MRGSKFRESFDPSLLPVFLIVFSGLFMSVHAATSCTVRASPVQELQPTSITCIFESDIGAKKSPFNVYRYAKDRKPELVASVIWPNQSFDVPEILLEEGVHVSGTITTQVRIILSSTSTSHTGEYGCQVLPAKSEQALCSLEVKEKPPKAFVSTCKTRPFLPGSDAHITCNFNWALDTEKDEILLRKLNESKTPTVTESVAHCVMGRPPSCHAIADGYEFKASMRGESSVEITILNANQSHTGTYSCIRISTIETESETLCNLSIAKQAGSKNVAKIAVPVVCVLLILAAICAGCVVFRRRIAAYVTRLRNYSRAANAEPQ